MIIIVVDNMEQVDLNIVIQELRKRHIVENAMDLTPQQVRVNLARLAAAPSCDRSRPPHCFAIYDEHGYIIVDDC